MVRHGSQKRLRVWITSPKCVEADSIEVEIDVRSDQMVKPARIDLERATDQSDLAPFAGSTQENDAPARLSLEVKVPGAGNCPPVGSPFDTALSPKTVGGDISGRPSLQNLEGVVMETLPDLGLPAGVEAFDSSLKAGFPGGEQTLESLPSSGKGG